MKIETPKGRIVDLGAFFDRLIDGARGLDCSGSLFPAMKEKIASNLANAAIRKACDINQGHSGLSDDPETETLKNT